MNLVLPAITRYRLTFLGVFMVFSLGVLTYFFIPRLEDPLIKVNGATVQVSYPGTGPRDVERYVTRPLENKINEIDQLDKITSTSAQGTALIMLEFDSDSDMDQNMQKLHEKVREVQSDLPQEAQDAEITRWKTETISLILNLSGPFSHRELHRHAKFIKRDLEKIPEIMTLEIDGYQDREIHVEVDEVLGAITSSTATTVLAFTPLLFMTGHIGQFIRGIPLTMIFTLTGYWLTWIRHDCWA